MSGRRHCYRRGFTLLELLIVIAIMSFLMAIVVASVSRVVMAHDRGESAARLRALAMALQAYRDDWGDVPPWNPGGHNYGEPADGAGLWTLVMGGYLNSYRMLQDPASDADRPYVLTSGGKLEVVPGDAASLAAAYNALQGGSATASTLTEQQVYEVYVGLANPANYTTPAATDFAVFDDYDEAAENYCSWMMQDPYTREWKYQPRRYAPGVSAPGLSGGYPAFPVDDATNYPQLYHRQLSRRGTDLNSVSYRPASDTVVTWSNLFRSRDRRPVQGSGDVGIDLVLYADGHVELMPGPLSDDWSQWRAVVEPAGEVSP